MTVEERREIKRTTMEAVDAVKAAYNDTDKPSEAIQALVETFGQEEASKMVAIIVNAVSPHDGRVYDSVREWSEGVPGAYSNEVLRSVGIYGVDSWIHSAHVNQIGQEMKNYEPTDEPEEPEDLPQIEEKPDERSDLQRECDAVVSELKKVYEGELIADEDGCVDGIDYGLCEGDAVTMWDWFSSHDVYDIEYMIGGDGDYRGVRLMVACGGTNVYINTQRREVEGYWSLDSATAWLPSEICEEIDEVWSKYYSMMLG